MRLVHETSDGEARTLAADVETADTVRSQVKGMMFRTDVPEDYALVFRIEPGLLERLHERLPSPIDVLTAGAPLRNVHMLFVRVPLDVLWIEDDEVLQVKTLDPWRGVGSAPGDTLVEMAAGEAAPVEAGDTVRLVESDDVDTEDGLVKTADIDGVATDDGGRPDAATGSDSSVGEAAE